MSTAAYGFDQLADAGAQAGVDKVQRKREALDEERRQKASDLIGTRNGILSKLPTLLGPNGEKTPEYDQAYQNLTQAQQDLGQLYHPDKAPGALQKDWHYLLEKMHGIPSTVAKKVLPATPSGIEPIGAPSQSWGDAQVAKQKAASMQKAQEQASVLASGTPLSPTQQGLTEIRTNEIVRQAQNDSTLRMAKNLGLSDTAIDELKQQLIGLKNVTPKPLTGAAGIPYSLDGGTTYIQPVSYPDGTLGTRPMPPGWKPNTKAIRGTLVNTKEHGWIQTWVNPYTLQVMGWQKVTPGSRYAGSTSSSSATDAAGVQTSASRATMPASGSSEPVAFDFSGAQQLPENYTGEEPLATPVPTTGGPVPTAASSSQSGSPDGKPASSATPSTPIPAHHVSAHRTHPTAVTTPASLKARIPAPPQATPSPVKPLETDAQGHVPENAIGLDGKKVNPLIREGANQLMDGVDMKDISLSPKDKPVAEAVARQYGWGRGPYLPRELKQMQNANQFLDQALNSKAFMRAIDQGFFRRTATALSQKDASKEGLLGTVAHQFSLGTLNADQREYLNIRQALMGTVSGLSSVVRTGRPTEATINRLAQEIPDVMSSSDSKMAREKIAQIKKELEVALAQGVPAPTSKVQHKVGDTVMYNGQRVKITKIYSDGTFDYI